MINPMKRIATAFFPGENDLFVDTASMDVFSGTVVPKHMHDFGATSNIVHTNYFSHPETSQKISQWFKIS